MSIEHRNDPAPAPATAAAGVPAPGAAPGAAGAMEVLSQRLARHVGPNGWRQLMHGAGAATVRLSMRPLAILCLDSPALAADAALRHAFVDDLDRQALARGGCAERFGDGEVAALFEDPRAALALALSLQREAPLQPLRFGLTHALCAVADFRGIGRWERTLLGGEAALAQRLAAGAASGAIALSAAAQAVLPRDLGTGAGGTTVLTRTFEGDGPGPAWLAPIRTRGMALAA